MNEKKRILIQFPESLQSKHLVKTIFRVTNIKLAIKYSLSATLFAIKLNLSSFKTFHSLISVV